MSWKDKLYCQANVYQKAYPNRLEFVVQVINIHYKNNILKNINGKSKIAHKSVRLIFDQFNANFKKPKYNIKPQFYGSSISIKSEELEKLKSSLDS